MISDIKHNLLESQNDHFFNNRNMYVSYIASNITKKDFEHEYQKTNFANNVINGFEKAYMDDEIFTATEQRDMSNICMCSELNELFNLKQKHKIYIFINGKRYSHMTSTICKINYCYDMSQCPGAYETAKYVLDNAKNGKDSLGVTLRNEHLIAILGDTSKHGSLDDILTTFVLNGYEINEETLFMILCHVNVQLVPTIIKIITIIISFDKKFVTDESIQFLISSLSYHACENCINTHIRDINYIYNDYVFDILNHMIDSGIPITFDMLRYARTNFKLVDRRWRGSDQSMINNIDKYNKSMIKLVSIGEKIIENKFDVPNNDTLKHACMSNLPEYLEFCLKHTNCDCTTEHLKLACKAKSLRMIYMLLDMKIEPNEDCVLTLINQYTHENKLLNQRIFKCVECLTTNGVLLTQKILELCIKHGMPFPKGTYYEISLDDSAYKLFHDVNITKITIKNYPLTTKKEILKLREECKKDNFVKIINSIDKLDHFCYDNLLLNESDVAVEIVDNAIKNNKYKPNLDSLLRIQDIRLRKKRYMKYIDIVNS